MDWRTERHIRIHERITPQKDYTLQLILERDALRKECQRLRQALKDSVRGMGEQ